ncbi:Oxygen sensor histidine kinase response regulator DevS/DosS [Streptomyces sp. RB5]|uniref:Oxygen sensor histidine kinase response regulator DevS/DosS n=1 Tax=Streptomyces smaragdinus TaxID=2585196 RepID=A0A7K0CF54_9ACTN|nr:GAF domain-containing protein [Streptomyces smaragdinus]MQY12097.1 Oxygen sensor histidine kinase response regulator DevS/DosS [Streptomyces smaragdinus]
MGADRRQDAGTFPRPQLDQLLGELQLRTAEVRGARDRIHGLLEAVLTVGSELDVRQVLRRIVEAAVVLVDAGYGALGVVGDQGTLAQFVTVGVGDEERARIDREPDGHGLIGELIRRPQPLRLEEIADHPASAGFPAGHPPMHSFLGVPIRVRDEVFGNLYLTEKRGGGTFDGEDQAVLSTLAVAAGVAVENARLYEQTRRRQRWLEAAGEVTNTLLSGADQSVVLELIVERTRYNLDADLGTVALPVPAPVPGPGAHPGELRVALALGLGGERHVGRVMGAQGTLAGLAYSTAEPVSSPDVDTDPRTRFSRLRGAGLGAAVAVPMGGAHGLRGVLMLARAKGKPSFGADETAPLLAFAGQAALAMELAERRSDAEQIALYEDRDRIARDLHDMAIQRLFATGMTLQSAMRFVTSTEGEERLLRAVDDLDETIKIIRTTIFGLRAHQPGPQLRGLRVRVFQTVEQAVPALGFTPTLRTEGLVDTNVPAAIADQVVAVLGEALSNAARHAHASAVGIALTVGADQLTLTVTDNGVGMPERGRLSGLKNLAERAGQLGGESLLSTPEGGGTRLVWRVPLPP